MFFQKKGPQRRYLITLLFALPLLAGGQNTYQFQPIGVDDGLSQGTVRSILHDARGYLWVGTNDGLNRFDGYQFEVFRPRHGDLASLAGTKDFSLMETSDGCIWIGHNQGLSRFDDKTGRFENHFSNDENQIMPFNAPLAENDDGTVWLSVRGIGFVRYDPKRKATVKTVPMTWATKNYWRNSALRKHRRGDLLYLYARGTEHLLLDLKNGVLSKKSSVMAWEELTGLSFAGMEGQSGAAKAFWLNNENVDGEIGSSFDGIRLDDSTELVAAEAGIYRFDLNTSKHRLVAKIPYPYCISKDRYGTIWVGSETEGLFRHTPSQHKFTTQAPPENSENLLLSLLATVDDSTVFGGNYGGRLDCHDLRTNARKSLQLPKDELGFALANYEGGHLLAYGQMNTLYDIDWQKGQWKPLLKLRKGADPQPDIWFDYPFLLPDGRGGWLFPARSSLRRFYKSEKGVFEWETVHELPAGATPLTAMPEMGGDRVWIGTKSGLFLGETDSKQAVPVSLPFKAEVLCILKTMDGNLWLGTSEGLALLDSGGVFKAIFTEKEGLPNRHVYAVQPSGDQLWLSTNRGLCSFDTHSHQVQVYTKPQGLQGNEFNTGAYCRTADGMLCFGGNGGINCFYPEKLKHRTRPPQAVIGKVLVNEKYQVFGHGNLRLPHDSNSVSVHFFSDDLAAAEGARFRFRLLGVDGAWQLADESHEVRYPKLPPGTYRFEVVAASLDGIWGGKPAFFEFEIVPPFWQKPWFLALCALVLAAAAGLVVWRLYRHQLEKQRQELEAKFKLQQERERISRDLHDNVGSQLSYLIGGLRELELRGENALHDADLPTPADLAETVQDLLHTLRETIWALNKEAVSLQDFADRLRQYVQRFRQFTPGLAFALKLQGDPTTQLQPAVALNLFRIAQEAVHNAFKHAKATRLEVALGENARQQLELTVTDDGLGFDPKINKNGHYGLENMRHRAAEIGASFTIESEAGNGATVRVVL